MLDVLAAVREAELVPKGLRLLVAFKGAREVCGRRDDARLVVAFQHDGHGLTAADARRGAQMAVDDHEVTVAAPPEERAAEGRAVERAAYGETAARAERLLHIEGNFNAADLAATSEE